ncbi:MAG: hypothetical protein RLZZ480_546 [Candidatus Parcubacteria bacterium]|jgi:hypothetical protein
MSETTNVTTTPEKSPVDATFNSEHAWMVQCLSLAALGLLTYMHIAPMIV